MGDRLGIPWGAAGFFFAPLPLKNPSADGRAAAPTRLPVATRHPQPGGNVPSSGKQKTPRGVHGGKKSLWEPAGGHGEQVPDAEGVRSSGQPPLPPSGHARAPLLLRPDAPGHGSQIRGTLPAFGRKVPSRGAYVGVRTGRNGQWGAAPICVNIPHEISSPWGKVAAGHIFRFLRLWGTQRPGHAGGRHWPHVGKRRTPDAGRRPASPVAGRRP